jgi:hypothetical protein
MVLSSHCMKRLMARLWVTIESVGIWKEEVVTFSLRDWGKSRKISVRTAGLLAEIQTKNKTRALLSYQLFSKTFTFSVSALDGDKCLASRPGRFTCEERALGYPLDRRLHGSEGRSGRSEDKNVLLLLEIEFRFLGLPAHCTDWAISALAARWSHDGTESSSGTLPNIRISSEVFLHVASSVWDCRACYIVDADLMAVSCFYFCCLELPATLGLRPCSLRKRKNGS